MPHPTRQAIARWAVTALLTGVVLYPLSYAPVVRIQVERHRGERFEPSFVGENHMLFYQPVDCMIDNTALDRPLFAWARLWGVEQEFSGARIDRMIMRRWMAFEMPTSE